jgi:membrane protein DedA with SNARE-associated domain
VTAVITAAMAHLHAWGIPLLLAVLFTETGLLVGFFLPGDAVLFTGGILVASGAMPVPLWVVIGAAFVAASAGDQVGYVIGRRWGPSLFNGRHRLLNEHHLESAHSFFERFGSRAVVLARFVPLARCFTPAVAGAATMSRRRFTVYNVVGGFVWVAGFLIAGYYLGTVHFIGAHVELLSVGIVAAGTIPVVVGYVVRRRRRAASRAQP